MCSEEFLTDVGMDIEDASEELLGACSLPYASKQGVQFIDLLMYTLGVFALGVEDDLLIEVVPVDEDVLRGVSLPEENCHPILKGKLHSQAAAQLDHLRHAINYHILLRLEICIDEGVPS
jgi:hypothetical protein